MKDKGFISGLVQTFDTSNRRTKGAFYGIRKMFWDYLNKINVPFYDPCCVAANGTTDELAVSSVRQNLTTGVTEYFDGTDWVAINTAYFPSAAQNNITAGTGGAISITNYLTTINTDAGGDAFTLADGTVTGQMKKILLVVDGGGDGVVTPATALADTSTTITFNDAADYVILKWNGEAWAVIENSGTTVA